MEFNHASSFFTASSLISGAVGPRVQSTLKQLKQQFQLNWAFIPWDKAVYMGKLKTLALDPRTRTTTRMRFNSMFFSRILKNKHSRKQHCTFFYHQKSWHGHFYWRMLHCTPSPDWKMTWNLWHSITCFCHYDIVVKTCSWITRATTFSQTALRPTIKQPCNQKSGHEMSRQKDSQHASSSAGNKNDCDRINVSM